MYIYIYIYDIQFYCPIATSSLLFMLPLRWFSMILHQLYLVSIGSKSAKNQLLLSLLLLLFHNTLHLFKEVVVLGALPLDVLVWDRLPPYRFVAPNSRVLSPVRSIESKVWGLGQRAMMCSNKKSGLRGIWCKMKTLKMKNQWAIGSWK